MIKNITLFDHLLSKVPFEVKKYVQKQGEIAIQIGALLKNKRITQKEFAKKINMKESQLSKILAGNSNCTLKTITKIEAALNEDIIIIPMFKGEFTQTIVFDVSFEFTQTLIINDLTFSSDYPEGTMISQKKETNFFQYSYPMLAEA